MDDIPKQRMGLSEVVLIISIAPILGMHVLIIGEGLHKLLRIPRLIGVVLGVAAEVWLAQFFVHQMTAQFAIYVWLAFVGVAVVGSVASSGIKGFLSSENYDAMMSAHVALFVLVMLIIAVSAGHGGSIVQTP